MDIFIGFGGKSSFELAKITRKLLNDVFPEITLFLSEVDSPSGAVWKDEIEKAIDKSKIGIFCMARNCTGRPWPMFEAGAFSTAIRKDQSTESSKNVIPLFLDSHTSKAFEKTPLGLFTSHTADKDSVFKLISFINTKRSRPHKSVKTLKSSFDKHWPSFHDELTKISHQIEPPTETIHEAMDHGQAFEKVTSLIREHIKSNNPSRIELLLVAVSMRYSLRYFERQLVDITKEHPNVKFLCKVAYVNGKYLKRLNLDTDGGNWAEQSYALHEKLEKLKETSNGAIQIEYAQFNEIPQRHGILLKLFHDHLLLSTTDWDFMTTSGNPRLTAGENRYRHYTPEGSGLHWIEIFKNTFMYYSRYQSMFNSTEPEA